MDGLEEGRRERKSRKFTGRGRVRLGGRISWEGGSFLYYFTFGQQRVLHLKYR